MPPRGQDRSLGNSQDVFPVGRAQVAPQGDHQGTQQAPAQNGNVKAEGRGGAESRI